LSRDTQAGWPKVTITLLAVIARTIGNTAATCPASDDHWSTVSAIEIDFVAVKGDFGPELIESISKRLEVPKNYMFIGTTGDRFSHEIEDLVGLDLSW